MLVFNQLEVKVGKRHLFGAESVAIPNGIVALVGRNGAGKSTFLKTIMGLHHDFSGEVKLNGKSLKATIKQTLCIHSWIRVGYTRECPKCLSTDNYWYINTKSS